MAVEKRISSTSKIERAASEAVSVIANAAAEAAKVVANAAAEASKSANVKSDLDHDILIALKTNVDNIRIDIKNLSDGTTKTIADHETRIRSTEKAIESYDTDISLLKRIVYGAVSLILITVATSVIYVVVSH